MLINAKADRRITETRTRAISSWSNRCSRFKTWSCCDSLTQTDDERVRAEGMGVRVLDETERLRLELADADKDTLSRREAIERLKADLKSLDEGKRRLEGASQSPEASGTLRFNQTAINI
jgi:hypothetical protein